MEMCNLFLIKWLLSQVRFLPYLYGIQPISDKVTIVSDPVPSTSRDLYGIQPISEKLVPPARKLFTPLSCNQSRTFWEYVNMMFNKPDEDRIKLVGPDRACAEWVLRNGGKVVWDNGKTLSDYNLLPPESGPVPKLLEIDGTESSISHYGFSHLVGCTKLQKVVLHNNKYIEDKAMKGLEHAKASLEHVQVSKCINVTDTGVKELANLANLTTLILYQLESVSDLKECKQFLKSQLPKCHISGK